MAASYHLLDRINARLVRCLTTCSALVAVLVVMLGALVLLGWRLDSNILKSVLPGLATMKANTALGFVLAGSTLWLLRRPDASKRTRRAAQIGALFTAALGLLTLAQYLFGWNLGIDQALFADSQTPVSNNPGRMAPATAFVFTLLGTALLLLGVEHSAWLHQLLAILALIIALLALIGYLYGVASLYKLYPFASVALHTACAFLLLAAGVLCARPEQGIMRSIVSEYAGGIVARRLLPAALGLPVVLGWLIWMGERAGFYDNEIVVIALVVTIIVLFTSLIWWNADVINRLEAQQQYAVERQRESQQAYQLIAENTSELITLIDGQGHIIYASPSYLPTLGYHPEEVQRINMNVYVHPDDLAGTRAEFRQLFERGRAQSILRYRHADSSWRWIEISGTHVVQQDRVFALIVGRDVTARKQMEDELREREYSYRTLLEQASDGIFVTNAQGDYITVNPRACEMLGYSESELLQMNVRDVLPPGETSRAPLRIDEIRAGHTVVHERQFLRKDGSRFPVEISAKVLNDGRMQGIVRDITERKRLESQLLQAQKMEGIGQLAGGIAHDFNNLLTVISGYADFVREALPPDDPTLADIDEIRKAAQRASSLTQQLLAFARKQVIEPYVINLNTLILNMEKLLRRLIGEDVDLVALPAPDLGQVRVDPGQIEQVIMNLAVNARDAMPDGGQLTIETANVVLDANYARRHISVVPGEYVLLAVSDTGSGMDEATQQHIFEPFFTTKAPGHGTGLGLATCYGIVKQHGGNIWLYSELGQGTTFKIYLPRVDEPPVDVFHRNERRWHGGSETVLIVEDEVAVRTLAVRALREHGYQVIEASNGSEALQLVRAQQTATIDLLLTDVVMPQMGGKALVAQLTEIYPQLKVLFVSGYAASAIVQHGQLEPNTMFLQKPFSPTSIVRKVREVLDGTS